MESKRRDLNDPNGLLGLCAHGEAFLISQLTKLLWRLTMSVNRQRQSDSAQKRGTEFPGIPHASPRAAHGWSSSRSMAFSKASAVPLVWPMKTSAMMPFRLMTTVVGMA